MQRTRTSKVQRQHVIANSGHKLSTTTTKCRMTNLQACPVTVTVLASLFHGSTITITGSNKQVTEKSACRQGCKPWHWPQLWLMSALSKLAVGQDAGTSRPATPQYADALNPNSHGKHSLGTLQPERFASPGPFTADNKNNLGLCGSSSGETGFFSNPNKLTGCRDKYSTTCELSKDLPVHEILQQTEASRLCVNSRSFLKTQQHCKQQVDSTSQAAVKAHTTRPAAATCKLALSASVAEAAVQSQRLSRPVTPHATKPYRAVPAFPFAQQHCLASIKHGPGAARVNFLAAHQHAGRTSMCTGGCSVHLTASRPASADAWQMAVRRHALFEGHGTVAAASPKLLQQLQPRPGSAAAVRILRAIDKACKLRPTQGTCGASSGSCGDDLYGMQQQQQPLHSSRPCGQMLDHVAQLSISTDGTEDASVHQLISASAAAQSYRVAAAPSSTLDSDGYPPVQLVQEPAVQLHHQALLGAHAAALQVDASAAGLSTRPATAALQSVLAAAACPGDGVDDHLAAIRSQNNALDGTTGLDILHGYGGGEHELVYEDNCGGILDVAIPQIAEGGRGQQAAPMVLNLEDMAQSTAEVIELELESLDVQQLQALSAVLGGR